MASAICLALRPLPTISTLRVRLFLGQSTLQKLLTTNRTKRLHPLTATNANAVSGAPKGARGRIAKKVAQPIARTTAPFSAVAVFLGEYKSSPIEKIKKAARYVHRVAG